MKIPLFVATSILLIAGPALADLSLPAVFGDHMVLQREMPVPVWGWADPGNKVSVTFADKTVSTTTNAEGKWSVKLPPMSASAEGRDLMVKADKTLTFHDVLVGEVWLCSGQSNMEFPVKGWTHVFNCDQEIAKAKHPLIRLINVPNVPAQDPQPNFKGQWQVCSPQTVSSWTAAGYFFSINLQKALGVPIGLVESDWGGTQIQPWIAPTGWKAIPQLKTEWQHIKAAQQKWQKMKADYVTAIQPWLTRAESVLKSHRPVPDPPIYLHPPLASAGAPTGLYNGMIAPVQTYGIRGALWYQGESNVRHPEPYFHYLQALTTGWRSLWGEGDFPFILVQIAPFGRYKGAPLIWDAEMKASREIKNLGLISTMDIGNLDNIHPKDKQDVGRRLSLWALANVYGMKGLICSGPTYAAMKIQGDKVVVSFDHLGGGLVTSDSKSPDWFELMDASGAWHKAQAEIQNDTVVVQAAGVGHPSAVRYAWSYKAQPNLKNKAGLPALPFDTTGSPASSTSDHR